MILFESDYTEGAHPAVIEALGRTNLEQLSGYGADMYTDRAAQKIREACRNPDAQVFFLTGGTQTNQLVIDSMLRGYEGVIAAKTGHISVHEAGAIEYSGHKVIELPGHDGKLCAREVRDHLAAFYGDPTHDHMPFPGMVYISFPTEYGTLYTKSELQALYGVCREYDVILFADGARLGYGLESDASELTLPEFASLCDVFYIGGTKVGALCGEALVFSNLPAPEHFITTVKQHGALLAKGRLTGVQFDALFTDGLYFKISRHAVEMANKLKDIFTASGCRLFTGSPTNQQFFILADETIEELKKRVGFEYWEKYDDAHSVVRFVTSWATTDEQLDYLKAALEEVLGK